MDILLQSFLDNSYMKLTEENKKIFERLLDEADADILDWVLGRKQPADHDYCEIVTSLQSMEKK